MPGATGGGGTEPVPSAPGIEMTVCWSCTLGGGVATGLSMGTPPAALLLSGGAHGSFG
jgi:hypothetical protein